MCRLAGFPRPFVTAAFWFALLIAPLCHSADRTLEAKIKAAYIYNLAKFVDWPELPPDAVNICVIGSDSIGAMLNDLANRQIKNRSLKVHLGAGLNPGTCQLLYISRSASDWRDILNGVEGISVLTVSDRDGFARKGGIVGFYTEGGKVKLEINPEAARKANLRISSKLMELARSAP